MKTEVAKKLEKAIEAIDSLKGIYKFYDENNEDEFLNELEAAVLAIDEMEDIIERDISYKDVSERE